MFEALVRRTKEFRLGACKHRAWRLSGFNIPFLVVSPHEAACCHSRFLLVRGCASQHYRKIRGPLEFRSIYDIETIRNVGEKRGGVLG